MILCEICNLYHEITLLDSLISGVEVSTEHLKDAWTELKFEIVNSTIKFDCKHTVRANLIYIPLDVIINKNWTVITAGIINSSDGFGVQEF